MSPATLRAGWPDGSQAAFSFPVGAKDRKIPVPPGMKRGEVVVESSTTYRKTREKLTHTFTFQIRRP